MNLSVSYLATLPEFLAWFGIAAGMLLAFMFVYVAITPWREFRLIREGNPAAAVSLMGTTVGYAIVLASVIKSSTSRADMLTWSLVGLLVQILAFLVARVLVGKDMRERMARGDIVVGIVLAGMSVSFGLLNAATMVPDDSGQISRLLDLVAHSRPAE